jgi:hypothetical protein
MRKYGESKTRIMMATVPHVTSGSGLRKFQADGFMFDRVYLAMLLELSSLHLCILLVYNLSDILYKCPAILQELSPQLHTSLCNNYFDTVYLTMIVTHVVVEQMKNWKGFRRRKFRDQRFFLQ